MEGGGLGDDTGGRLLDRLKFMEVLLWETAEKIITILKTGGD